MSIEETLAFFGYSWAEGLRKYSGVTLQRIVEVDHGKAKSQNL